jgi:hypothetical protein
MKANNNRKIPKGHYLHIPKGTYKNKQNFIEDLYISLEDVINPDWITTVYEYTLRRDMYITNTHGDSYSYSSTIPTKLKAYYRDSLGEL